MTENPPTTPMRTPTASTAWSADSDRTEVIHPVLASASAPEPAVAHAPLPAPESRPAASAGSAASVGSATSEGKEAPPQRIALVVVVGMSLLAIAFIVLILVNPTSEAINALAVIAAPIAAMVAAYYGITLSIQQVKNERAEKEKALARAEAAEANSRETEVWSAQMESGLRVAMAKLTASGVTTSEVTKAAGTPADFF